MAGSVRASLLGHEYQHRQFWIEASRLFIEIPAVSQVGLECGDLRAFDDVVTDYGEPIYDDYARLITGDHFQCKFHTSYDREIRASDLPDPRFINAKKVSLLERLGNVTRESAIPRRLTLISAHRIDRSDPLRQLVSPRDGEINVAPLFDPRATLAMQEVRETWRRATGATDDDNLRAILQHLRIRDGVSMDDMDERLDGRLFRAGLASVDRTSAVHKYTALAQAFIAGGRYLHDRAGLEAVLKQERLWVGRPAPEPDRPEQLGIKSFAPFAYDLEDEARVLSLLPYFHGRETAADVQWDGDILPPLVRFLRERVRSSHQYDLHLDTHLSIAFAAGYVLDKADAPVTPIQRIRGGGRIVWADSGSDPGPLWEEPRSVPLGDGPEVALAVEVTAPIADDVAIYCRRALPRVGSVQVVTIAGGPSRTSVRDGGHAHALAAELTRLIAFERVGVARAHPLHVFAAAPVGLFFLLGRSAAPWGSTVTYEYDFDRRLPGAYTPAFHLPPAASFGEDS